MPDTARPGPARLYRGTRKLPTDDSSSARVSDLKRKDSLGIHKGERRRRAFENRRLRCERDKQERG